MCGMCPSCAFAPTPPASTRRVWKVSDEFKRMFLVELLLRCRNTRVLEGIHGVLAVATSGTLFTYARSRRPTSPRDYPRRAADPRPDEKPLGMDVNEIWHWFNSSPEWKQSSYLCRLFSLCDCELLRMAANLTSVLLVRQKRGFLQFNGKKKTTSFLVKRVFPAIHRFTARCRQRAQPVAQPPVQRMAFHLWSDSMTPNLCSIPLCIVYFDD